MKKYSVDLHMHSTYSDGSKKPLELLQLSSDIGLTTIALTDHDEIAGSKELIYNNNTDLTIYSGVEFTVQVPKGRMHILGYNIDLENKKINERIKTIKEDTIYNIMLYIEVLRHDFGIILPEKELLSILSKVGNVARPHIAALLVKHGYCKEIEEAFQKYLNFAYEKVRKRKRGLSKEECVDLILSADGIVSLAHPSSLKLDDSELDKEVAYLKSLGMQCIEVIHINNSNDQRKYYEELAKKYSLLISGGTDFHGYEVKPDVSLGSGRNGNVEIHENTLTLTKNIKSRYAKNR